jgi:hypothetical protein
MIVMSAAGGAAMAAGTSTASGSHTAKADFMRITPEIRGSGSTVFITFSIGELAVSMGWFSLEC